MTRTRSSLFFLLLTGTTLWAAPSPNIIFILCDDLGFGDTGPTYQNQRAARADRGLPSFATPHLDRLAAEGVQLKNHYTAAPVCAPSRASFLLGQTQGHANVRDNQFDKALADTHTVASVLKAAGYATAAVGKWGLQGRADGRPSRPEDKAAEMPGGSAASWPAYPTRRGFDFYYGYVRHRDGHFHYPKEDQREVWENENEVSSGLDLCYTTDLFTARTKKWIVEHQQSKAKQPFFVYLAFDTPHAKLELPPCPYPGGGGLTGGVQWTGKSGTMINTAAGQRDGWMDPEIARQTWDHDRNPSTPEVSWPDVQKRYAASVQRIDDAVGDLLQLLKDLKLDENTVVIFTSDNGPSKESYLKEAYDPTFFSGYGDFSGIKRDTLEGGIREPALVRWPGRISGGRIDATPTGMWEWLATFAEIAGIPAPATSDGASLLPLLTGMGKRGPSAIYVEYFNTAKSPDYTDFPQTHRARGRQQMQSVWVDGYMGVRYRIQSATDDFEIYDVETDPRQAHDLGRDTAMASLQEKMKARVLQMRRPEASAKRPYDDAVIPGVALPPEAQPGYLAAATYSGAWPWIPDFRLLAARQRRMITSLETALPEGGAATGLAVTGWFHANTSGRYTFQVESDSGATVFFHEARLIDGDAQGSAESVSASIYLAQGWHPLRIYSRHEGKQPRLKASYTAPDGHAHTLSGTVLAGSKGP
ncbi:MAG TPA: sulfatase-like hydrolase/transferase [Opitutaceae bacterium]|nr:sulfatase-like hydrolase/transferase [Opitutaceae bacterium]